MPTDRKSRSRRRPGGRAIAVLVVLATALPLPSGCITKRLKGPDLGEIYNRAARYHQTERNPVVVVPGMMGSKLVDQNSGSVVWGAFTGKYAKPNRPEGARLVALPMREGEPLARLTDGVHPDGVLDRVRVRFLGIPLRMLAYFHILGALGAGGYRDEELGLSGAIDYGDDHFTCFQFAYDWRRDISESAARLAEFLEQKREYVREGMEKQHGIVDPDIKFDIVAHSMGGLVTRYYLRYGAQPLPEDGSLPRLTWEGAKRVANVILVGPPNAGSVLVLREAVEGYDPGPMLARYAPAILGSMPSVYQVLPRGRHRAVVVDTDAEKRVLDPYDPEVWEQMGWGLADPDQDEVLAWLLPELPDPASRRRTALDHLRKSLRRARQLTEALDVPASPPPGLMLYLIAGDSEPTAALASVDPKTGRLRIVGRKPGDGTVLRSSVLMDERVSGEWSPRLVSPIDWSNVTFLFHEHLKLTRSPEFTDNVLFQLLEKE